MRILAFETSAKAASVALLEDDTLLGELYLNCGLTHSRTLLESAQRLLEITELTAKDIDAVACAAGPGSFTGVDDIVDRGLMNGTGPVTFEPDSTMTRAMLVTVLWRSAGSPNEGTNGFTDVPADQWYTQAVAWAAQNGIVNGVGNNKFDPDAKITREQLAAVLYRYAGKVGMDVTARADLKLFPDAGSVSAYATDALSWCVANGIVNGTLEHGTAYLDPQGSATRAQVATLMSRYLKLTEA